MNNLIKKNAIDKLIMLASNGKLDKNDFTIEEKDYLINCINLFQFLISYPEVKDEKTFDLLSRSCKKREFYTGSVLKNASYLSDFNSLELKNFLNDENQSIIKILCDKISNFYFVYQIYEKSNDLIKTYLTIEPCKEILSKLNVSSKLVSSDFKFPIVCSKERTIELLKNSIIYKNENDEYKIPLSVFTNLPFIKQSLKKLSLNYILLDDKLILKDFYKKGGYRIYKDVLKRYSGFMIVDEHGNLFDEEKYSANAVLYYLRACIAGHSNFIRYNLLNENFSCYGVIFITNERSFNENTGYKRAVVVDSVFLSILYNMIDVNEEFSNEKECVFIPKNNVLNENEIDKFLSQCGFFDIKCTKRLDDYALYGATIYDLEYKYNNNKLLIKNKDDYKRQLESRLQDVVIEFKDIKNIDIVKRLIPQNLTYNNKNNYKILNDSINFLFKDFYDSNLFINSNIIKKFGDVKSIKIKRNGIIRVTCELIRNIGKGNYTIKQYNGKYIDILNYHNREALFVCSWFIAYLNLVQNQFEEKVKNNDKITLEILDNLDFSNFFIIGDSTFNNQERNYGLEDKKFILRAIRNSICHYKFLIELTKSADANKSLINFYQKKNEKDVFIKSTIEDFLKFISNEKISNYGNFDSINIENIEDLYLTIKNNIENY